MEITLEKVELVKDRTGVSYKEAKEALEAADGNVVDAIVGIEETINVTAKSKINDQTKQVVDKIKEAVEKGNVSRIRVKREDETVLNLPVNIGILGIVLAPVAAVIGTIAAFGMKCTIELVKDDGSIVDISEKANDKFGAAIEKGGDIAETLKEKGGDIAETLKDKGGDFAETLKEKGGDAFSTVSEKVKDTVNKTFTADKEGEPGFKDAVDDAWEEAKERVNKASDSVEEIKDNIAEEAKEAFVEAADKVADAKENIADAIQEKAADAKEAIEDAKEAIDEKFAGSDEIKIDIIGDLKDKVEDN